MDCASVSQLESLYMINLEPISGAERKSRGFVKSHPKDHRREEQHFFSITDTVVVTRSDPIYMLALGGKYTARLNGIPESIVSPLDSAVLIRQLKKNCLYGKGESPDEAVLDLLLTLAGLEGNTNPDSEECKVCNIYFLRYLVLGFEEDKEYEDNHCFIFHDMFEALTKLYPKTCEEIRRHMDMDGLSFNIF